MFKSIILSAVILHLLNSLTYSQTDIGSDTKFNVSERYGITREEIVTLKNQVNIERNIPQYLVDQLEKARINENIDEVNKIQNKIDTKYSDGIHILYSSQFSYKNPDIPVTKLNSPPFNPDWMGNDVLVYDGYTRNYQHRTLDIKMAEDGNIYIAIAINTASTQNRLRVYRSTNSGLTWTMVGGLYNTVGLVYGTISLLVERRHLTNNDSVRCIVYYTQSNSSSNDGATLKFFSFRPNAPTPAIMMGTVATPGSGNEFNYVSAISDGQYYSASTYLGCVVGEYNNAGDDLIKFHYFQTNNWCESHTSSTFLGGNNDFYPFAAFKNDTNDSLYIAVERRFSNNKDIRIIKTNYLPTSSARTYFLTNGDPGVYYEKPVLSIQQTHQSVPKRIIITCTKNDVAKYHRTTNGGSSWDIDYDLDRRDAPTTNFTWVSTDTNTNGGGYCVAIFADIDSINVRKGVIDLDLGPTYYKCNSSKNDKNGSPVCAVYRNMGNNKSRAFAYWRYFLYQGDRVKFDAEHLPIGIHNTNTIATTYSLSQNYPNPFNPITSIKFSIPLNGFVKLIVYDVLGKEVATLVNDEKTSGTYEVTFDASKLNSGVYFYRITIHSDKLTSGDFSEVKKMLLVK